MTASRLILIFGLVNLTLLGFLTPMLDGALLAQQDPLFFSWPGVIVIALWGLAYMASAAQWQLMPGMMAVFAVEKFFFAGRWGWWMSANSGDLGNLMTLDPMVGLFFSGYGIWDGFCGVVFAVLAIKGMQTSNARPA